MSVAENGRSEVLRAEAAIRALATELAVASGKAAALEQARQALVDAGEALHAAAGLLADARAEVKAATDRSTQELQTFGRGALDSAVTGLKSATTELEQTRLGLRGIREENMALLTQAGNKMVAQVRERLKEGAEALAEERHEAAEVLATLQTFVQAQQRVNADALRSVVGTATQTTDRAREALVQAERQLVEVVGPASKQILGAAGQLEQALIPWRATVGRAEAIVESLEKSRRSEIERTTAAQARQMEPFRLGLTRVERVQWGLLLVVAVQLAVLVYSVLTK